MTIDPEARLATIITHPFIARFGGAKIANNVTAREGRKERHDAADRQRCATMSADAILKIALAIIPLLIAVIAPTSWFFKEFVTYLLARIAVLEERETVILTAAVGSIRQQGEELTTQGTLIRELAKQSERREWLREHGRTP